MASGFGNGAQGRSRTTDTAIFSRMLYQLSYLGAGESRVDSPGGEGHQPRSGDSALGASSSSSGGGPGMA